MKHLSTVLQKNESLCSMMEIRLGKHKPKQTIKQINNKYKGLLVCRRDF